MCTYALYFQVYTAGELHMRLSLIVGVGGGGGGGGV